MEFDFSVNELFPDSISGLDKTLASGRTQNGNAMQKISQVVDKLGDASAKAQNLPAAITSASKLIHSDHKLYLLKDADANRGHGAALGFIKVGHKRLFVFDNSMKQHEVEPLCVLDFYVHESKQRQGHGKQLFEHMVKAECIKPCHLAIDRPSAKFVNFLLKHYNLRQTAQQVNNFVIFEGFFSNRPDAGKRFGRSRYQLHEDSEAKAPSGRAGKRLEQSADQSQGLLGVLSGSRRHLPERQLDSVSTATSHVTSCEAGLLKNVRVPVTHSPEVVSNGGQRTGTEKNSSGVEGASAGLQDVRGLSAQASAYSRHQASRSAPVAVAQWGATSSHLGPVHDASAGYREPIRSRDGQARGDHSAAMAVSAAALNAQKEAVDSRGHLRLKPLGHGDEKAHPVVAIQNDGRDSNGRRGMLPFATGDVLGADKSWNHNVHGPKGRRIDDTTWSLFGVPSAAHHASNRNQLARPF